MPINRLRNTQDETDSAIPVAAAAAASTEYSRILVVVRQLHGQSDILFYVIQTKQPKNGKFLDGKMEFCNNKTGLRSIDE